MTVKTLAPPTSLMLTAEEAASELRLGRSTVYELMASHALKFVKVGRARRIRRADLEEYVRSLVEFAA